MRIYGIIRNNPAVMLTWLYLPKGKKDYKRGCL